VDQEASIDEDELAYRQAKYPIELDFADADQNDFVAARKAIRREFRDAAKWKRLRCRKVRMVSESESGSIFELEIGHAVEFDWTWEGAVAFRPLLLKEFEQDQADMYQHGSLDPDVDDSIVWSGEVLEVDEATGRIFIVVATPEFPPRCGSFYVRPFEFLAFLDAVFNEPSFEVIRQVLPGRLAAAAGGIHPEIIGASDVGLEEMRSWWARSWSVLWGPPGTGKTYTTGRQVASVLTDPTERILVVSTTNRATDAAALSIGRAARTLGIDLNQGAIRRIGKGASFHKFQSDGLWRYST